MPPKTLRLMTPPWMQPLLRPARYKGAYGGRGCVHPDTPLDTPGGPIPISQFKGGGVYAWHHGRRFVAHGEPAQAFDEQDLYRVELADGRAITVTDQHKFLVLRGRFEQWRELSELKPSDEIVCFAEGAFAPTAIIAIHPAGRQVYWDLEVLNYHNYLSNGIVNHNSGKSYGFTDMLLEELIVDQDKSAICIREVQSDLAKSVKRLLEFKIETLNAGAYFEVQNNIIRAKRGKGIIAFTGMQDFTADSIKSLEGFNIAWVEEAHSLSQRSLDLLRPTIRSTPTVQNPELWFTWNPDKETDPVDMFLRGPTPPPNSVVVRVNYMDNPWFPDDLRAEMEYDKTRDLERYYHVWLGEYAKTSEARVFKNWQVQEFTAPDDAVHRFGADWGFAEDPTVLLRCHVIGRKLFIDYEAYRVGCEIKDLPSLFLSIPEAERWPIVADSSRPETISYMQQNGFTKMLPSVKGKNSVFEGIEFMKAHDIIVHPRCVRTIDELTHFSYKIDRKTKAILPQLAAGNDHAIDCCRYALEGVRRIVAARKTFEAKVLPIESHW